MMVIILFHQLGASFSNQPHIITTNYCVLFVMLGDIIQPLMSNNFLRQHSSFGIDSQTFLDYVNTISTNYFKLRNINLVSPIHNVLQSIFQPKMNTNNW